MTPKLLICGGGLLNLDAIRATKEDGFEVVVADGNPQAPGFALADHALTLDIRDGEAVLAAARTQNVSGIMPTNDFAVPAVAYAACRLGLPGISEKTAQAATDKGLMRDAWAEAGLAQPAYVVLGEAATAVDALHAACALGFPVIVKPAFSGGGGRGVRIVRGEAEIEAAFALARSFALNGRVLVETFIVGTELTVETLSYDGQARILGISDKIKPPLFSRVATTLTYPAALPKEVLERVRRLCAAALKALGIAAGAAHTEVIVGQDGQPKLVECGARGGGGHIFGRIVQWISGVSMPVVWAQQLTGRAVLPQPLCERAAIYHFFTPPQGRLIAWHGLEEAARIKGVAAIGVFKKPGDTIHALENSLERSGYVVIECQTRAEAEHCLQEVCVATWAEVKPDEAPHGH